MPGTRAHVPSPRPGSGASPGPGPGGAAGGSRWNESKLHCRRPGWLSWQTCILPGQVGVYFFFFLIIDHFIVGLNIAVLYALSHSKWAQHGCQVPAPCREPRVLCSARGWRGRAPIPVHLQPRCPCRLGTAGLCAWGRALWLALRRWCQSCFLAGTHAPHFRMRPASRREPLAPCLVAAASADPSTCRVDVKNSRDTRASCDLFIKCFRVAA